MNINFFASLVRLSHTLGKGSHSLLVTTQKRSKDFLVTTITESFYLAMYFTFMAFLVGLSASLRWRYKDQLVSGFVRNNLPAVGNPSNKITWETFEHVGSKELLLHHLAPLSVGSGLRTGPMERLLRPTERPWTWAPAPSLAEGGLRTPMGPVRPAPVKPMTDVKAWEITPAGGPLALLVESPLVGRGWPSNPLVERIDVYNDSFVIKPKTPWQKLQSQKYVGFYISSSDQYEDATLGTSLTTTGVSNLSLESRAELIDQLGLCSPLASSGWLHVPARGFVDFPKVDVLSASCQQSVPPRFEVLSPPLSRPFRADAQQEQEAAHAASASWDKTVSNHLVHPLAPATVFTDKTDLPIVFGEGFYPFITRSRLTETTADQARLGTAADHLPDPSKGLIEAVLPAQRKRHILRGSLFRKWVYQFFAYLDEMPYKLGSTKLSPDNLALIESTAARVSALGTGRQPTDLHFDDLDLEDKLNASLEDQSIRPEELNEACRQLLITEQRLKSNPVLDSNLDAGQPKMSASQDVRQTQITTASSQVGIWKPNTNRMREVGRSRPAERETSVGRNRGNALIGIRVMDAFSAPHSPPRWPCSDAQAHQTRVAIEPSKRGEDYTAPRSQPGVGPSHVLAPVSELASQRLGSLERKQQAFATEATMLLESDGVLWRGSQSGDPSSLLLNELNSTEVVALIEEGVKALEDGWEDLLVLLNDSVSRVLSPIRPVPIRLMSGYSYPDSTRPKLARDLSHWAVRHWFDLRGAASTLLLAEREILLPASPSLPLPHSKAQGPSNAKRQAVRQMPPIPIAEIDYLPVSLSGLSSLRDVLVGREIEALEGELDEIPLIEATYQGPAVARDKVTNDLVGRGREELTAWVVKAMQGYGGGAKSGTLANLETALSVRQGNRLGKKEVLRSEPLGHEKLLAGVRARTGLDVRVSNDKAVEARKSVEPAPGSLQPVKSSKMIPERFLTGLGPKLRDASQVLAIESGDEAPLYPLEIVLTKASPLFEEEEEVLFLEPDEWRNIFKSVVVQALENKGSLDKIEILMPSIAVAHSCLGKQTAAVNGADLAEVAALSRRRARSRQPAGGLQKGHLGGRYDRQLSQQQPAFGKADELARVLTSQEYTNLGILVAQSKRFVGECGYWPVVDPSAAASTVAPGPKLLCHYLPLSQVAIPESSAKQPISAGSYQKRLTSFTARYPFNSPLRSRSTAGRAMSPFPLVQGKQQMFHQLWEPVTANSWMMFYKLCFAFWIQEMGKDFYQRYGKEIILYALNLLVALGFDAQGMIEDLGLEESPMRVITNGARRFEDIAGIDSILPELGEIVWFLRSSGRGGQVPKGILLVGPPGTGKTFVVQAIAGEARVPVIVQSASSLRDSGQKQSGSQKLRDLFDRARQLSPCILFMDEIDTLGVSRPHVIGNTMGADELLESIERGGSRQENATNLTGGGRGSGERNDDTPELDPYLTFSPSPRASRESMLDGDEDDRPREEAPVFREGEGDPQDSPGLDPSVVELIESHNEDHRSRQERLALLMQFLMEMDGLRALHGVVVIGATNRPAVLDPAFTRPGRFEKVLCLQLPGKQKRIEILKLYSRNLGLTDAISPIDVNRSADGAWEYLANRTAGWSAAHLAAAMNQSAIRAIIEDTSHTIETMEHGIGAIARRSFQASPHPSRHILVEEDLTTANALDTPFLTVSTQSLNSIEEEDPWWENLSLKLSQAPAKAHLQIGGSTRQQALQASQASQVQGPTPKGVPSDKQGRGPVALNGLGVALQSNATRPTRGAFSIARWSYYQAGKAVLQTILPLHPPAAFLSLRPQPFAKSSSDLAKLIASTPQQGGLEPHRRVVLETRLMGLYAGKASEMLAFAAYSQTSRRSLSPAFGTSIDFSTSHQQEKERTWASQSDLGIEELNFAGVVANSMITSWYLYSKRVALQGMNLSIIARNVEEIDDPVLLDLLRHLEEDIEHQVERATRHPQRFQQWASPSWWQTQVMAEASLIEPGYSEWYRIYIPDPEETERNIDWVPPEDHYHAPTANRLRNVSRRMPKGRAKSTQSGAPIGTNRGIRRRSMGSLSAITWNDLYLINRDYIYHGLINSCFQKAFVLLDQQRELVDFLSDHLIRYDLLRQYEIEQICSNFGLEGHSSNGTPNRSATRRSGPTKRRPVERNALGRGPLPLGGLGGLPPRWPCSDAQAHQARVAFEPLRGPVRPNETGEASAHSRLEGEPVEGEVAPGQGNEPLDPFPQDRPEGPEARALTELAPLTRASTTFKKGIAEAALGIGYKAGSLSPSDSEVSPPREPSRGDAAIPHSSYVVEPGWGFRSRRRISRFIDFDFVKPCYLKREG